MTFVFSENYTIVCIYLYIFCYHLYLKVHLANFSRDYARPVLIWCTQVAKGRCFDMVYKRSNGKMCLNTHDIKLSAHRYLLAITCLS